MVKTGKVKIEGKVMCDYCDTFLIPDVKISILRSPNGSTDYPQATGIETFTNGQAFYRIEYEGDTAYEYYIKPEKDVYYYQRYGDLTDCDPIPNSDPGYIVNGGIKIFKNE